MNGTLRGHQDGTPHVDSEKWTPGTDPQFAATGEYSLEGTP